MTPTRCRSEKKRQHISRLDVHGGDISGLYLGTAVYRHRTLTGKIPPQVAEGKSFKFFASGFAARR